MNETTIICCAVTGAGDTPKRNPAVPVTPAEIARSSLDAAAAGAAMVHIHVRHPETGRPSMALEHYREVVERIRAENPSVIINLTTGPGARFVPGDEDPLVPGGGTTLMSWHERIAHVEALRPEICSLDVCSMNYGDYVIVNSAPHLRQMARRIRELGVVPELEAFDAGHVRLAADMIARNDTPGPGLFQLCLGTSWGAPATPETALQMRTLIPAGATWFAFGIGASSFPIAALSVLAGGHVRVGLEDNLYLARGTLAPSNASLVERAARIVTELGSTVASTREARRILGLGPAPAESARA